MAPVELEKSKDDEEANKYRKVAAETLLMMNVETVIPAHEREDGIRRVTPKAQTAISEISDASESSLAAKSHNSREDAQCHRLLQDTNVSKAKRR